MVSELRPSDIFYSQDSISNRFSCRIRSLGDTLDELVSGSVDINSIPTINVVHRNDRYYSVDNRRLWVFQKAEELGFLETIQVNKTLRYKPRKFTTTNRGTSVRVRGGDLGGSYWRSLKPKKSKGIAISQHIKSSLRVQDPYEMDHRRILTRNKTATDSSDSHTSGLYRSLTLTDKPRFVLQEDKHNDSRVALLPSQYFERSSLVESLYGHGRKEKANILVVDGPEERWRSNLEPDKTVTDNWASISSASRHFSSTKKENQSLEVDNFNVRSPSLSAKHCTQSSFVEYTMQQQDEVTSSLDRQTYPTQDIIENGKKGLTRYQNCVDVSSKYFTTKQSSTRMRKNQNSTFNLNSDNLTITRSRECRNTTQVFIGCDCGIKCKHMTIGENEPCRLWAERLGEVEEERDCNYTSYKLY